MLSAQADHSAPAICGLSLLSAFSGCGPTKTATCRRSRAPREPPGQDNDVDFEEKLSELDQRKIAALKEAAIGCVNRYFETCK